MFIFKVIDYCIIVVDWVYIAYGKTTLEATLVKKDKTITLIENKFSVEVKVLYKGKETTKIFVKTRDKSTSVIVRQIISFISSYTETKCTDSKHRSVLKSIYRKVATTEGNIKIDIYDNKYVVHYNKSNVTLLLEQSQNLKKAFDYTVIAENESFVGKDQIVNSVLYSALENLGVCDSKRKTYAFTLTYRQLIKDYVTYTILDVEIKKSGIYLETDKGVYRVALIEHQTGMLQEYNKLAGDLLLRYHAQIDYSKWIPNHEVYEFKRVE